VQKRVSGEERLRIEDQGSRKKGQGARFKVKGSGFKELLVDDHSVCEGEYFHCPVNK
jgi:hypothetical protein